MRLSIIIPCLNEEKYIEQCINSVLNNDFSAKEYELIIVDGGSSDQTVPIVEGLMNKYPNIRLLHNPKKIAPVAMNLGINEAKGDIIMRMDAHSYYPSNYISTLLTWKDKLKADNIGAQWETDVLNKTKVSIANKIVLTNRFGVGNGMFRLGVEKPLEVDTVPFGCYDKSIFSQVGLYDERLKRNQDIELNKRLKALGKKIYLIPYTYCRYYARESYAKLAKNNYNNGLWNLLTIYYTKNIKSLSLRHLIPLFFILSLLLPSLLSFFYFPLLFVSLAALILYLGVLTYVISKVDLKGTSFLHVLISFFVLHFSYGAGSFIGLFHFNKLIER